MALKIITAYKPGGVYTELHIDRLKEQVEKYSGYMLECVYGDFPGWWCKMEIFQEKGPVLYFDLDTVIVDDLTPLIDVAKNHRFVTLRDFNSPKRVASGVMAWNGDMSHIYDEFAEDPDTYMDMYPGGDQDFIGDGGHCPEYFQDLIPHRIQSFKLHVRNSGVHKRCSVVCYHGSPKFTADKLVIEAADLAKSRNRS